MADPLYLSTWFPVFDESSMMPHTLSVLKEFPYSAIRPGISSLAVHPVSWAEPTILERQFNPGITPLDAVEIVSDLLHSDYAYAFETYWDLWVIGENGEWSQQPQLVRFLAHGVDFDDAAYEQNGHVQVDFGLDTDFLFEDVQFTRESEERIRENVAKLIAFTLAVERNSGIRGRVLWCDSEENLVQKLISRLQNTQ